MTPPTRVSHSGNASPASRSPANCPTTRTTASETRLAGSFTDFSPNAISMLPTSSAEQHVVAGSGPTVGAAFDADEADVGDVVLAAGVRAAGDVDAHATDLGQPRLFERVADVGRQATRLRDREVAGVGTGAGDDVADELGAGFGHADGVEPGEEVGELLLGEATQREVLPVRDPDLGVEVALDLREAAELVDRDVTELAVGVRAHRAVGAAAYDVGGVPPAERIEVRGTRPEWPWCRRAHRRR